MSIAKNVPRGLSSEEQSAWARLAQSVTPMAGRSIPVVPDTAQAKLALPAKASPRQAKQNEPTRRAKSVPSKAPPRRAFNSQLDATWNRKLKAGQIAPDYTLDLHGHTLDAAYERIIRGLDQARTMSARVVLVIAGRERPVDPADRGTKRGAIRAKLLDWIAASHHADAVSAVRRAHIRHGGDGALYLVLKRNR